MSTVRNLNRLAAGAGSAVLVTLVLAAPAQAQLDPDPAGSGSASACYPGNTSPACAAPVTEQQISTGTDDTSIALAALLGAVGGVAVAGGVVGIASGVHRRHLQPPHPA